jgi:predicted Zn-dependent peptidase
VAVGYKVPMGIGKDYVALVVLGDVLLNGDASRLYQGLVKGKELMLQVQGGVNFPFESPWRNAGPTLFSYFGLYKPGTDVKAVVEAAQAEIAKVATAGVPATELTRVKNKMRADFYAGLELPINRADSLALAQLLLGDGNALNTIPADIDAVTVADLQRVAAKYLSAANRTVVDRKPAPAAEAKGE